MEKNLNATIRTAYTRFALAMLVEACKLLAEAGTPKTLERVRAAISSAKGAVRNARGRELRDARTS